MSGWHDLTTQWDLFLEPFMQISFITNCGCTLLLSAYAQLFAIFIVNDKT